MENYEPKGYGRDRAFDSVAFEEAAPPKHLAEIVHRYIRLRTTKPLSKEYRFHALPDACTYMVFDQSRPDVVGVSRLHTSSEEFNLGIEFHYINVRFFPGTWQNQKCPTSDGQINTAYSGKLPLLDYNRRLIGHNFDAQQVILNALVEELVGAAILVPNAVTQQIMRTLGSFNSVADMAKTCDMSSRQLQRILMQSTGLPPMTYSKYCGCRRPSRVTHLMIMRTNLTSSVRFGLQRATRLANTKKSSMSERLCWAAQIVYGDSSRESSVVAGLHEQTDTPDLQDQELASL